MHEPPVAMIWCSAATGAGVPDLIDAVCTQLRQLRGGARKAGAAALRDDAAQVDGGVVDKLPDSAGAAFDDETGGSGMGLPGDAEVERAWAHA